MPRFQTKEACSVCCAKEGRGRLCPKNQPHAQGLKKTKQNKTRLCGEAASCKEMGREAPLRGPVQTFGGYVLCLGLPEITTALTFIEHSP